ncbi:MAG TPA: tRNA pseudouridine(55) synthase TruB, partial [Ktedonobacteraceae bacterium]|nr:tRNA pseudouridine(55) synthase TruB [Ktedonobacteraceae bacterium]
PADKALENYPAIHLNEEQEQQVRHGNAFTFSIDLTEPSLARVYNPQGLFIAIAEGDAQRARWQPKKVFSENDIH